MDVKKCRVFSWPFSDAGDEFAVSFTIATFLARRCGYENGTKFYISDDEMFSLLPDFLL